MANKNDPQELDIDGPWPAEPEPRLVEFLAYWRSKHDANGDPPRQKDINPGDIAHLLPGILILERQTTPNNQRYLYRLAGTSHYEANGLDLTGRYVDDIYDAQIVKDAYAIYERIFRHRRPHYWAKPNPLPNRELSEYERIIMPLRAPDNELSLLIGYWLWH